MTSAMGRARGAIRPSEHGLRAAPSLLSTSPPSPTLSLLPGSSSTRLPACWAVAWGLPRHPVLLAPFLRPASDTSVFRRPGQEALTKRMGGGVGGGLRGQDDELCRAVLGEGEDGGHGAWHGGGEAWGQVLVQGRVPKAWGHKAQR